MSLGTTKTMAEELERELMLRYGPLIANDDLRIVLGYPSMAAFRQALSRKKVPIPVLSLENRRGKYALAHDVAVWLAAQRQTALLKQNEDSVPATERRSK